MNDLKTENNLMKEQVANYNTLAQSENELKKEK